MIKRDSSWVNNSYAPIYTSQVLQQCTESQRKCTNLGQTYREPSLQGSHSASVPSSKAPPELANHSTRTGMLQGCKACSEGSGQFSFHYQWRWGFKSQRLPCPSGGYMSTQIWDTDPRDKLYTMGSRSRLVVSKQGIKKAPCSQHSVILRRQRIEATQLVSQVTLFNRLLSSIQWFILLMGGVN